MDSRKIIPIATITMLLFFPLIQFFPLVFGDQNYVIHLMLYAFYYIVMTSSWNIIGGYGGFISVGHNAFLCIGAYIAGYYSIMWGVSPFYLILLAGIGAGIFGFFVGLITLRVKGPSFIISSIALIMILRIIFDRWELVGGASGITLPYNSLSVEFSKFPHYYGFLILAIITIYMNWYVRHSKFGLALRAISHDEIRSAVAGINVKYIKVTAFVLSTFFIGCAGAIWADYLTYVRPNIFLIILIAANVVLMVILGGMGTVTGPIIGTIIFIAFNELILSYLGATELNLLFTGLLLVITLLYFPNGIVGTLKNKGKLPRFLDWG